MFIPISLQVIAFTVFLVLFIFHGIRVAITIAERFQHIISESDPQEILESDNSANRHSRIVVPDVLSGQWPWPRRINPHYIELDKEVATWVTSFKAFSPKAQDAFDRGKHNLLGCMAYPNANKEHARAGCTFLNILFMIDEYSDRATPSEVVEQKSVIMDAFRNPHAPRPEGEWIGGEVIRQFWERTIRNATEISQRRFVETMNEYMEAVVQESIERRDGRILDVKSYIGARRRNGGVKSAFVIFELGLEIPDEVMSHPTIQDMVLAAIDLISFANDILSYNVEQAHGKDLYNMITCVMKECDTDVNGAIQRTQHYLSRAEKRFLAAKDALPEWEEPLNSQVKEYCDGLGQWVRANRDWSFESERYLGEKGVEIRERGLMSLLPKNSLRNTGTEIGPVRINSSLL